MVSPGLLIAAGVVVLYTILGPVVLFLIYTLFDTLGQEKADQEDSRKRFQQEDERVQEDPALWTETEIRRRMGPLKSE